MKIVQAGFEHLDSLATLFDEYRIFYQQPSDLVGARAFLRDRLTHRDSVIFIALDSPADGPADGPTDDAEGLTGAGFTQLYPSFSSVSMAPLWILNDLYVNTAFRRQGLAQALMNRARTYGTSTGAVRIELATWVRNFEAQSLYESLDYQRADINEASDSAFYHYSLEL